MKKHRIVLVFALCLCALLTGCMNSGGRTLGATQSPTQGLYTASPNGTDRPAIELPGGTTSGITPFDWVNNAAQVQEKINRLSEVQSSVVVVTDKTALVGVTFTGSYAGELTQRIHDLVAAQVQAADDRIQTVAVTADETDVKSILELARQIQSGTPVSELEQQIDSIVRNVTTMQ